MPVRHECTREDYEGIVAEVVASEQEEDIGGSICNLVLGSIVVG
jgi:hypothetical protein